MTDKSARHLQTANTINELSEARIRHPLNSNSEVLLKRLSQQAGLERLALYIARIPPGKESFAYHKHERNEEFIYILSGRGIAQIAEKELEIGPGDFMGFPAPDGPPHHLINPFKDDLVYLMGGECSAPDVAHFPRLGKSLVFTADDVLSVQDDQCEHLSLDQWVVE